MLVCIVIAIIPMAVILGALVNEAARLVQSIQSGAYDTSTLVRDAQAMLPDWAQRLLERFGVGEDLEAMRGRFIDALQQIGQLLATRALTLGQNTLRFIASTGIMLYVLFFLFRDGRGIGRTIRDSMPLTPEYNRALLVRFAAVVRATVKGNIVIAVIQGTIGGVAFWALGIQGALLWGALMVLLSLLPAVGAAIVWVPAAVYLFVIGSTGKGLILVAIGGGVIAVVDNLLRPVLVGKDTRLPDYVILVSTVGGLSIFGINGFVIGPLIAALFISAWTIFRDERHRYEAPPLADRRREPARDKTIAAAVLSLVAFARGALERRRAGPPLERREGRLGDECSGKPGRDDMASFTFFDNFTTAQTLADGRVRLHRRHRIARGHRSERDHRDRHVAVPGRSARCFGALATTVDQRNVFVLTVGAAGASRQTPAMTPSSRATPTGAFVTNGGRIRSRVDALDIRGDGPITILNTGTLFGRSDGIVTESEALGLTRIVNRGTIDGDEDGGIDHLGGDAVLVNRGTIAGVDLWLRARRRTSARTKSATSARSRAGSYSTPRTTSSSTVATSIS